MTRAQLLTLVNTLINNNNNKEISAQDVRDSIMGCYDASILLPDPEYMDWDTSLSQQDFSIAGKIVTNAYVYVNGVKIRDTQYTLANNGVNTTLHLNNPTVAKEWVSIEF